MWLLLNASSVKTVHLRFTVHIKLLIFQVSIHDGCPSSINEGSGAGNSLYDHTASGLKRLNDEIYILR